MSAALATDLVLAARVLRESGYPALAESTAQAAKVLAGANCIDCGGSVLGGRSLRCASCRHTHRTKYHRSRYLAQCERQARSASSITASSSEVEVRS